MPATKRTTPLARRAFTYDEVAQQIGRHRAWVYRQVKAGKIRPIIGYGTAMISADELNRILGVKP